MTASETGHADDRTGILVRVLLTSLGVGAGFAALSFLLERPMPEAWAAFLGANAPILQIVGAVLGGLAVAVAPTVSNTTARLRHLHRRATALETRPIPMVREDA